MPDLTYNMEQMISAGSDQRREGYVLLDGVEAIKVKDMWSIHPFLKEEQPGSRVLGLHANSDRLPLENLGVLREVVKSHEKEYWSPDSPSSGQFYVWHKGVVVLKADGRDIYDLSSFLYDDQFDRQLNPNIVEVRVYTPNGHFTVDYQPHGGEKINQVSVLSHKNISGHAAELLTQTADLLMPHQDLKGRLQEIFNEIMGHNYQPPARKPRI